jgi:hypothetical protein
VRSDLWPNLDQTDPRPVWSGGSKVRVTPDSAIFCTIVNALALKTPAAAGSTTPVYENQRLYVWFTTTMLDRVIFLSVFALVWASPDQVNQSRYYWIPIMTNIVRPWPDIIQERVFRNAGRGSCWKSGALAGSNRGLMLVGRGQQIMKAIIRRLARLEERRHSELAAPNWAAILVERQRRRAEKNGLPYKEPWRDPKLYENGRRPTCAQVLRSHQERRRLEAERS